MQAERLGGMEAEWHDDLGEVPQGPLLLVANEFLDALPVHQLVRTDGRTGWNGGSGSPRTAISPSCWMAGHRRLSEQIPERDAAAWGAVAEVSPARAALARQIGARIAVAGGVALVIDYGAWPAGPTGDTLQAVRGHAPCAPLAAPGEADLSAQVDFRALAEAASAAGAAVYGPVPQGTFLRALGIEARALQLLGRASAEQRREAARRPVPPDRSLRHGRSSSRFSC